MSEAIGAIAENRGRQNSGGRRHPARTDGQESTEDEPFDEAAKVVAQKVPDNVTFKKFKRWLSTWNNYATLTKLDKRKRDKQVTVFRSYLSDDFNTRLTYAIGVPEDSELELKDIIEKIRTYLKNQTNVVIGRKELIERKQQEGETFDDFLVDLLEKAADAEIEEMEADDWKTTLIVCGIRDRETRKKLLSKRPALNLQKTIDLCRDMEGGEQDADELETPKRGVGAVRGRGGRGRGRGG